MYDIDGSIGMVDCKHCGKAFVPRVRQHRTFCTDQCKRAFHDHRKMVKNKTPVRVQICRWCNKVFETDRAQHYYCNTDCEQQYNRRRARGRVKRMDPPCVICGGISGKRHGKSKTCDSAGTEGKDREVGACSTILCADRCRKSQKGAGLQRVADLYQRQEHRCNGCKWPLPIHVLEVDHVVPRSNGGSKTDIDNQQLLCNRCNSKKHNKSMAFLIEWLEEAGQMAPDGVDDGCGQVSLDQYMATWKLPHHGEADRIDDLFGSGEAEAEGVGQK